MTQSNEALNALYGNTQPEYTNAGFIDKVAQDFTDLLNEWHSLPEVWDNALDAEIHRWYANPPKVFPKKPYFSPSSANACPRELYMKATGAKRDGGGQPPYQKRWTSVGTAIGDIIQRDLLFIEKHGDKLSAPPRFKFERNAQGLPMFEDFAKTNKLVEHDGETFYLFGAPDGIMQYVTDDGEVIRIGLEVKTKQTTAARTSLYSMREPDPKHVAQVVGYAEMYDVDYYLILYVNLAKKAWEMSDDDFMNTPDIRVFGIEVTPQEKARVFDHLAKVQRAVKAGQPPALDVSKWTFNSFKRACAESLTDEEYAEIESQVKKALKSGIPTYMKQSYRDALEYIRKVRGV